MQGRLLHTAIEEETIEFEVAPQTFAVVSKNCNPHVVLLEMLKAGLSNARNITTPDSPTDWFKTVLTQEEYMEYHVLSGASNGLSMEGGVSETKKEALTLLDQKGLIRLIQDDDGTCWMRPTKIGKRYIADKYETPHYTWLRCFFPVLFKYLTPFKS
jgi:hypothetical protein